MPQPSISKENMDYLIQGMNHYVDSVILQRGWMYYRNRQVTQVTCEDETIRAVVKGNTGYEVKIDLLHFERSGCSCPYDGYCKHIAAVFFTLYDQYQPRPELFLQEHLQYRMKLKRAQKMKKAKAKSKAIQKVYEQQYTLQEHGTTEEWHKYFESKFKNYFAVSRFYYDAFYHSVTEHLLPPPIQWDKVRRHGYEIHVYLFILHQTERQHSQHSGGYVSNYEQQGLSYLLDQCLERIKQVTANMKADVVKQSLDLADYEVLMKQTMEYVSERLFASKGTPVNWYMIYQMLWLEMWNVPEWRRAEQEALEERLTKLTDQNMRERVIRALVHFDLMTGHDDQAMHRLESLDRADLASMRMYLERFEEQQEWDRLRRWLQWYEPKLNRQNHEQLQAYCRFWDRLLKQGNNDQEWLRVMKNLLPYSFPYYTPFLLKHGRYEELVDIHLWLGNDPLEIDSYHLKMMEKESPQSLLPLYHQGIERNIHHKKRESYQNAVRMLKTLKHCYAVLHQTPRWEFYFDHIRHKYARLRAFQEELKRGKLI
ncbi:SWIM zinc finger family protein [Marinicrinis lubricantis]|uniref:SWIM zinc finger domain-containing protein n=1 Tax=Marinicrinis lubricantis TaxID=2086470 RepID=A0ABW1IJU1_9BACL